MKEGCHKQIGVPGGARVARRLEDTAATRRGRTATAAWHARRSVARPTTAQHGTALRDAHLIMFSRMRRKLVAARMMNTRVMMPGGGGGGGGGGDDEKRGHA